jgi:hypothetical protein
VFNAFSKKLEAFFHLNGFFKWVLCHITKHPPFQWFFSTQNPSISNAWEVVERPTMLPAFAALAPAPRRKNG